MQWSWSGRGRGGISITSQRQTYHYSERSPFLVNVLCAWRVDVETFDLRLGVKYTLGISIVFLGRSFAFE